MEILNFDDNPNTKGATTGETTGGKTGGTTTDVTTDSGTSKTEDLVNKYNSLPPDQKQSINQQIGNWVLNVFSGNKGTPTAVPSKINGVSIPFALGNFISAILKAFNSNDVVNLEAFLKNFDNELNKLYNSFKVQITEEQKRIASYYIMCNLFLTLEQKGSQRSFTITYLLPLLKQYNPAQYALLSDEAITKWLAGGGGGNGGGNSGGGNNDNLGSGGNPVEDEKVKVLFSIESGDGNARLVPDLKEYKKGQLISLIITPNLGQEVKQVIGLNAKQISPNKYNITAANGEAKIYIEKTISEDGSAGKPLTASLSIIGLVVLVLLYFGGAFTGGAGANKGRF